MKCLIAFFIDCTALSAAPFDHGDAVDVGKNFIFNGSMNALNSFEFAIPDSLSHLKYLGTPKGDKIVSLTASIMSDVCLDFKGFN